MIALAPAEPRKQKSIQRDIRILFRFIEIHCHGNHGPQRHLPSSLPCCDLETIMGRPLWLCPECEKLASHAYVKRTHCRMDPKPQCKHCPNHCYAPHYRQQIRKVMAYSGRKLVMRGRLDYLLHLLF